MDLKEEIQTTAVLPLKVENPTISENDTTKDVKDKKQNSNISMSEELESIFCSAVRAHIK